MKMLKENIKEKLFTKFSTELPNTQWQISLLAGDCGVVMVQGLLYKTTLNPVYKKTFDENMFRLYESVGKPDFKMQPTYCNGLAGFGWLAMYLNDIDMLELDEDFFFDLDTYLQECLVLMLEEDNWDIFHGALGIGLYFLKRNKPLVVEQVINYLERRKSESRGGYAWERLDKRETERLVFDFGLAHGNAGVLYFLKKCVQKSILRSRCMNLIEGGVKFYFNTIQNQAEAGSFFRNFLALQNKEENQDLEFSRLAWCYGDLAILYTLYKTCKTIGNTKLLDKIEAMLVETTKRTTYEQTLIKDIGICHGSTGLALIYRCIFEDTNNEIFRQAQFFWEAETLMCISGKKKVYDYIKEQYVVLEVDNYHCDLLDGLAGAALLYSTEDISANHPSADENKLNNWKELFFLD